MLQKDKQDEIDKAEKAKNQYEEKIKDLEQ